MSERQWYYMKGGQQHGPIPEAKLVDLFREGALEPATQVWTEQSQGWRKASEIEWLAPSSVSSVQTTASVASQSSTTARPTAVTVFGVLNIVFGSLGLLSMPCGMIAIFATPDVMNPTEAARVWLLFSSIIGFACTILLIIVGIGLLKLKSWARKWSLGYGWFAIVWGVLGTIINTGLTVSGAYGYSDEALPGAIGGTIGGLIGLIYPILLVVFMQRSNVKNACTR